MHYPFQTIHKKTEIVNTFTRDRIIPFIKMYLGYTIYVTEKSN